MKQKQINRMNIPENHIQKILIIITLIIISIILLTVQNCNAQLDITKRSVTVTENFYKNGDSVYTASEVDALLTTVDTITGTIDTVQVEGLETFVNNRVTTNSDLPDSTWQYGEFEDSLKVTQIFSTPYQITYATSITFNGDNGMNQYITLTGNVSTCNFSNLKPGATYTFKITQDATGSRTFDETDLDYKANESANFSTEASDINLMVIYVNESGETFYSISTYTP